MGEKASAPPPLLSFAHVLGPKSIPPPPPSLTTYSAPYCSYSARFSKFRGGESQKPGEKTARAGG